MTTNWMERWAGGSGRLARMLARAGSIGLMGWATLAYADHPSKRPRFCRGALQSNGVYLLSFPSYNTYFGYYNYNLYPNIYHYDLGSEWFIDGADSASAHTQSAPVSGSPSPAPRPELVALQSRRVAAVLACRNTLHKGFGDQRFALFETFLTAHATTAQTSVRPMQPGP